MGIILGIIVGLMCLAGLVGIVIPFLPDLILIFVAAFLYSAFHGFAEPSWVILSILAIITGLGFLFDYLGTAYGTKKAGASSWGILGAIVGGIVGLIFGNIIGLFIGAFLGTVLIEFLVLKKTFGPAIKAGGGALLGIVLGYIGKIVLAIIMIGLFLWSVL